MPDCRANYPLFQAHLSHENDNLNQRLFWYVFSQSLLLGAYSSALNAGEKLRSVVVGQQQDLLVWLMPGTALLLSLVLYPMIIISVAHMAGLRKQFESQAVGCDISDLPPIHGNALLRRIGDAAYLTIPLVLIATWLILVVARARSA